MCVCYLSISSVWRFEVGCCHWEESPLWKPPVLGCWIQVQDQPHHWGALEDREGQWSESRGGEGEVCLLLTNICYFTSLNLYAILKWDSQTEPFQFSNQQKCRPVISMAFSEVRFSVLPRSPTGPLGPNAAISSMSDRRPALWDLQTRTSEYL